MEAVDGGPQAFGPGDSTGAGPTGAGPPVPDSVAFDASVMASSTLGEPVLDPLPLPRPPLLPAARVLPRPLAVAVLVELGGVVMAGGGSLAAGFATARVGELGALFAVLWGSGSTGGGDETSPSSPPLSAGTVALSVLLPSTSVLPLTLPPLPRPRSKRWFISLPRPRPRPAVPRPPATSPSACE